MVSELYPLVKVCSQEFVVALYGSRVFSVDGRLPGGLNTVDGEPAKLMRSVFLLQLLQFEYV